MILSSCADGGGTMAKSSGLCSIAESSRWNVGQWAKRRHHTNKRLSRANTDTVHFRPGPGPFLDPVSFNTALVFMAVNYGI